MKGYSLEEEEEEEEKGIKWIVEPNSDSFKLIFTSDEEIAQKEKNYI